MSRVLDLIGRHRRIAAVSIMVELAAALALLLSEGGHASVPPLPPNDLQNLLALTGVPTPAQAPVQTNPEPKLAPVPRAHCGAGSHPLNGEQGRVPATAIDSPQAATGWTCNTSEVSHFSSAGGFRTWRYIDPAGHVCAFYDTSLFSPSNVVSLAAGPSPGVVVLDLSDPSHPKQTAMLTSAPMLSPHESLNLNEKRGLLGAEMGNGGSYPGLFSIYDASHDCRHPTLDATYNAARFGHESGFARDGRTFWIAGGEGIAAVDVTDPKQPRTIYQGNVFAHGLNLNDSGTALYDSEPIDGNLVTLDVSQVQSRKPNPVVKEISRLTWGPVSIPQNTDPMEIDGKPYLLEFDEFAFRFNPPTQDDTPGAARIIDISDPAHPRVVSNLRLQVNMPANHKQADSDPSPLGNPAVTYAAHYCNIPREIDPEIAACSFINSGLRIFNIQNPRRPREIAYFIAPPKAATVAGAQKGDLAMSQPAFDPTRRQIWYTDATSGFYVVQLAPRLWPHPTKRPPQCAPVTGTLSGAHLGPIRLGESRATVARHLPKFTTRGRRSMVFYCLNGRGIRAGYPSNKLLRSLPAAQRARTKNRAVLLLTANRHYTLNGVRQGTKLSSVAKQLHAGRGYTIGLNTWYLVPFNHAAVGLLKVRHGVIEELGLVLHSLTGGRARNRAFLKSFD